MKKVIIVILILIILGLFAYIIINHRNNNNLTESTQEPSNTTSGYSLVINVLKSASGEVVFKDGTKGVIIGQPAQFTSSLIKGTLAPKYVTSQTTWSSSDEKIVKVDNNGLVIGISKGTANIIAQYKDESKIYNETYKIVVIDNDEYLEYENNGKIQLPESIGGPDSPTNE